VDEVRRSRKSVTRKYPELEESSPFAKEAGQRVGTILWMALRDVCSPFDRLASN
jgi:hypothetical protein